MKIAINKFTDNDILQFERKMGPGNMGELLQAPGVDTKSEPKLVLQDEFRPEAQKRRPQEKRRVGLLH